MVKKEYNKNKRGRYGGRKQNGRLSQKEIDLRPRYLRIKEKNGSYRDGNLKDVYEALDSITYYLLEYRNQLRELRYKDKTDAVKREIVVNRFMTKNLGIIKNLAVSQLQKHGFIFFSGFMIQENENTNQRHLFSRFLTKDGGRGFLKPAQHEDLALAIKPFSIGQKEVYYDKPLTVYPGFSEELATNVLCFFANVSLKEINGWKSTNFNNFNTEKLFDENGEKTPEFPLVKEAMEKLKNNPRSEEFLDKKTMVDKLKDMGLDPKNLPQFFSRKRKGRRKAW